MISSRHRSRPEAGLKLLQGWWLAAALLCTGLLFSGPSAAQTTGVNPELRELLRQAVDEGNGFSDRFEAEVWLTDMALRLQRQLPDERERLAILKRVHYEASRADIPPELVLAVIEVESAFDRFAISRSGAQGLMQIMPFWLKEIGHPDDNLMDIGTNLRLGCTILRYYLDKERGDLQRALARYNGSHGRRRYPDKVFKALYERWYRQ